MTSKLITPERPLLIPPLLAAEIGLNESIILQQIHYFCGISDHIKSDGRAWFWKTLKSWGEALPFLSVSSIRRAIANLKNRFGLIDIDRLSKGTWYQANWFTINTEALEALWLSICSNQQMEVSKLNTSICSERTTYSKDNSSKITLQNIFNKEAEKMKIEEMNLEVEDYSPETVIRTEVKATPNHSTTVVNKPEIASKTDKPSVEVNVPAMRRDPFFSQRRSPKDLNLDWIPDGPWKVEGKLDAALVDWHAKRWMQKYKTCLDIHDARKNVRAYYRNDPARLANDWQEYQESTAVKLANMALREQNDVRVGEDEKVELQRHQGAFRANPDAPTVSNTGEIERYKEWIDNTKPMEALTGQGEVKRLEAEREIPWEAIAENIDLWQEEQIQTSIVPEGAENPAMYTNRPRQEDIDFYRNLHKTEQQQKRDAHQEALNPHPGEVSPQKVWEAIGNLAKQTRFGVESSKEELIKTREEREREACATKVVRKIKHWNGLLATGLPTCMDEARRQAENAGYQVIDNQVVPIDCNS